MKTKHPFYRNGILIGVLLFVAGIFLTGVNDTVGPLVGTAGIVVFFVSLVRAIFRAITRKKRGSPPEEMEQAAIPESAPQQIEPPPSQPPEIDTSALREQVQSVVKEAESLVASLDEAKVLDQPTPSVQLPIEPEAPAVTIEAVQNLKKLSIDNFLEKAAKVGYVAFDFETTGLSPDNDRITEIGAIKIDVNGNEVDRFTSLVNPQMHLPSRVAALTGLNDEILRKAPTIEHVLPEFLQFVQGYPLMAWNVSFDKNFLEKSACRCNIDCEVEYADALVWARKTYDLPSYKQDLVAEHIKYVPTAKHRAAGDCETLLAIIKDMQDRRKPDESKTSSSHRITADLARRDDELNANAYELAIADHFIAVIKERKPEANPVLERRSQSYLSLCLGENDFLRIKFSDRAKWISIDSYGTGLDREDPLFAEHENKNQRHWKVKLRDISDVEKYDEYVIKACK